ncbi:MAG: hypothetical protein MSA15_12675 [Clostridium sp.]|nr:hypothetical protein [Clostridium sp.]
MELTLYKKVEINISMQAFIEYLLHPYRSTNLRPYRDKLVRDRNSLLFDLNNAIENFTAYDLRYGFDNPSEIMQTIMKNAYFYAIEHNYPQMDIDMLKEIIYGL